MPGERIDMRTNAAMGNYIVVEWSPSQKAFHSESVADMLRCNLRAYNKRSMTDYLPIGFFDTKERATDYIRTLINRGND
jgi:hypothetical protein